MKDHCILAEVMTEIAIRNITANISSLLVTSSLFPPIELAPVVNKVNDYTRMISWKKIMKKKLSLLYILVKKILL